MLGMRRPPTSLATPPIFVTLESDARCTRRRGRRGALFPRTGRRAPGVRRLPAPLSARRRPARPLLRARARGLPDRTHHLGALERLLRRSHREEASEPLPARDARALLRDRRLQPGL